MHAPKLPRAPPPHRPEPEAQSPNRSPPSSSPRARSPWPPPDRRVYPQAPSALAQLPAGQTPGRLARPQEGPSVAARLATTRSAASEDPDAQNAANPKADVQPSHAAGRHPPPELPAENFQPQSAPSNHQASAGSPAEVPQPRNDQQIHSHRPPSKPPPDHEDILADPSNCRNRRNQWVRDAAYCSTSFWHIFWHGKLHQPLEFKRVLANQDLKGW